MKRKSIIWVAVLVSAIILVVAGYLLSPIRWPEKQIKHWVLRKAPLGSSIVDVKDLITRQGWELNYIVGATNYFHAASKKSPYVSGTYIIRANFGHYQGLPWRVDVGAFWGFNPKGELIDVHVQKDNDSW